MRLPPIQAVLSRLVAERDVQVTHGIAYGPGPRHRLDLFEPRRDAPRRGQAGPAASAAPICLFLYGGSWRGGSRSCYGFVGAALASRGITTVVADYRLFPEVRFPAFIEDAARAYAFVAEHMAAGPSRSRPIAVAGHSAGAHIAALMAFDLRYLDRRMPRPAGLIAISGPHAFDPTSWDTTAEIFATARSRDDARPVAHVSADAPPALLLHGEADRLVKPWNSRELKAAYERHGRPVRHRELRGLGHVEPLLALARPLRWRAPVLDEVVDFLSSLRVPEEPERARA